MALQRLKQTLHHLINGQDASPPSPLSSSSSTPPPSFFRGPTSPPLLTLSMGQLLEQQATQFPDRDAIVIPWSNARYTFSELNERSKEVARGLIAMGVKSQDRIGIFSGNCERYIELFFAVCRIGAIFVVLNPVYTKSECINALKHAGCSMLFTAVDVGRKSQLPVLTELKEVVEKGSDSLPFLKKIIVIRGENPFPSTFNTYESLLKEATLPHTAKVVDDLTKSIDCHELCNFQFTSGTTGAPKAVTLTHYNVINNGFFIGHVMRLRRGRDVLCCPPPLYHAFGLVLGLLACYTHGVAIVFPGWSFDPIEVLDAVVKENCTGLHGVPTMLVAVLQQYKQDQKRWGNITLRTGIAAGSPVPRPLMEQLQQTFSLPELVNIYGMTELSGASFITAADDGLEEKLSTVGRVIPHTLAKVVGPDGKILPCGTRGELCMAGFGVQQGYYQNKAKTDESMIRDAEGNLWMHSGDEAMLDERGYAKITGRIKDMIIRGGENVYPFEIEQRLGQHPAISQSSVVGLKDERYGEVVAAFLEGQAGIERPRLQEIQAFVRETLGGYNAPVYMFWVGEGEVVEEFPKTSSGKIKKVDLRDVGNKLVEKGEGKK